MSGWWAIYRRELAGLFVGPLAWVLLCIAWLFNGWLFVLYVRRTGGDVDLSLRLSLGEAWPFWALLVLVPPLLTMRMISEEARSGTLEFLLTAPVSDAAVVGGKFAAALSFMALLWSCVFVYAAALSWAGLSPDLGALCGGYLGALLCSALFCALGLLVSSMTATPILAAFAAVVLNLVVVILPFVAGLVDAPWMRSVVARVDVIDHHQRSFLAGVLDSAYAVFFLAWTALGLFLATRAVESRRWRP